MVSGGIIMTSKIKTCAQAIQTKLAALNDGATPTPKVYLDHVWIGVPKKIPMGDKCIAMIEILSNPNYYYTTCAAQTQYDVDFMINVVVKGNVETTTLYTAEMVDIIQTALLSDQKISNSCLGSTIEDVDYVEVVQDNKSMATGARIRLRCRL